MYRSEEIVRPRKELKTGLGRGLFDLFFAVGDRCELQMAIMRRLSVHVARRFAPVENKIIGVLARSQRNNLLRFYF